MIITDTNNLIVAAAAEATKEFGQSTTVDDIRSYFMTTILNLRKQFSSEYGIEMVLAFDGVSDKLWRRQKFPFYKIRRSASKASSPMDWDLVNKAISEIRIEFDTMMPYKVVYLENCEGDDIIAAIVRNRHTIMRGDIGTKYGDKTLIVSADHDMLQLQRLQGVDQYSSPRKEFVRSGDIEYDYFVKVIKGDPGDDVPSSISQDDQFMTGTRQKAIRQNNLDEWVKSLKEGVIPEELVYYERNKMLISLFDIPKEICIDVMVAFDHAQKATKSQMVEYFAQYRLKNFMDQLHLF